MVAQQPCYRAVKPVQSKGLELNGENIDDEISGNGCKNSMAVVGIASGDLTQRLATFANTCNWPFYVFDSEAELKARLPIDALGIVVDFEQDSLSKLLRRGDDLRQSPQCRIVVTSDSNVSQVVTAMHAGVHAVIEPAAPVEVWDRILGSALKEAKKRKAHYAACRSMLEILNNMTEGELLVLRAVVDGQLNKRIARLLEISERTVEARRKRIFEKTGTNSVAMLVRLIVESIGVVELYRKCDERCGARSGGLPNSHASNSTDRADHLRND